MYSYMFLLYYIIDYIPGIENEDSCSKVGVEKKLADKHRETHFILLVLN